MDTAARWERVLWASPWLLFLSVPVADLVSTDRPTATRVLAGAALTAFTVAYLSALGRIGGRLHLRPDLVVVVVLGGALAVSLGVAWVGLMVYVSAAAAATLRARWAWPTVSAAVLVCVVVGYAEGAPGFLFLPAICLLTAFALLGTRVLLRVNGELREAREEPPVPPSRPSACASPATSTTCSGTACRSSPSRASWPAGSPRRPRLAPAGRWLTSRPLRGRPCWRCATR